MALFNPRYSKPIRAKLRRERYEPEIKLWYKIRGKQLGFRFRSQYGIGRYIVDFCCPRLKIVIEVDGSYHGEESVQQYDAVRQQYLEAVGFTVLRYAAVEVLYDIDAVLVDIHLVCLEQCARRGVTPFGLR